MAEVVCLGEALIDFVASESGVGVGEASGFLRAPGGAPANVAVGVAKLGGSSAFIGKVGDDPFGRFLAETFARSGVDVGGMVFDPAHRTGLAFVSLRSDGERDFCFFRNPSADMTFAPEELDRAGIQAGRVFHFGSITLIDEPARTTTLAAIETARTAGLLISYDPNLRPPLWPNLATAKIGILSAVQYADIVKVSAEELAFLLGGADDFSDAIVDDTAIDALLAQFGARFGNVGLLVVTRGGAGCAWRMASGRSGKLPGFAVQAIDTTGAGDGFVAGLLVGLLAAQLDSAAHLAGVSVETLTPILRQANAVGALTTMHKGAIPSLPTRQQVQDFIQRQTIET